MERSLGKNHRTLSAFPRGTVLSGRAGSLPGKNTKNTSTLPKLGRNDLIREVQSIVLPFPIKEVAEQQDTTTKAVESQRNGDSAMSLLAAANMSRSNLNARAKFARLFGFPEHYGDPDFLAAWEGFAAFYERKKREAEEGPAAATDDAMGDLFGNTGGNA